MSHVHWCHMIPCCDVPAPGPLRSDELQINFLSTGVLAKPAGIILVLRMPWDFLDMQMTVLEVTVEVGRTLQEVHLEGSICVTLSHTRVDSTQQHAYRPAATSQCLLAMCRHWICPRQAIASCWCSLPGDLCRCRCLRRLRCCWPPGTLCPRSAHTSPGPSIPWKAVLLRMPCGMHMRWNAKPE